QVARAGEQLFERVFGAFEERLLVKQILAAVGGKAKLGKHGEDRLLARRLAHQRDRRLEVVLRIADAHHRRRHRKPRKALAVEVEEVVSGHAARHFVSFYSNAVMVLYAIYGIAQREGGSRAWRARDRIARGPDVCPALRGRALRKRSPARARARGPLRIQVGRAAALRLRARGRGGGRRAC